VPDELPQKISLPLSVKMMMLSVRATADEGSLPARDWLPVGAQPLAIGVLPLNPVV
tara:strand:+ start:35118 stop:35285 length:168 start_codon:yes stop_codon:yes gene_type:complete